MKRFAELREQITAFDQDLINKVFYGRIRYLDAVKYNHFARILYNKGYHLKETREAEAVVIHYTGPKPWSITNGRTDIEMIWWEYAKKTPYYTELMEELLYGMMQTGYENTNEFRYQKYLEQQYLEVINDSRALIEKLAR